MGCITNLHSSSGRKVFFHFGINISVSLLHVSIIGSVFFTLSMLTFITDGTADDFICLGGGCAGCSTFCSTASTRRLRPVTATCGLFTGSSWSSTLYLIIHGLGLRVETDLFIHLNF